MWNDTSPHNPSNDICEYGIQKDSNIIELIPDLVSDLATLAESLAVVNPIWREIHIFECIQTKYKKTLNCKCLSQLLKLSVSVEQLVVINLSKAYLNLGEKFFSEMKNSKGETYFLPSRQQLEYVLVRTLTAAKSICETLHYSREAFGYLLEKLKEGHLIIDLMIATSVAARLNITLKTLLLQFFHAYKNLFEWRKKLKKGFWEWPKPLNLPGDLEEWVNREDPDYLITKHLPKEELDYLNSIFIEDKNQKNNHDVDDTKEDEGCVEENFGNVEIKEECVEDDVEKINFEDIEIKEECVEDDVKDMDSEGGVPVEKSEFEKPYPNGAISDSETNEIDKASHDEIDDASTDQVNEAYPEEVDEASPDEAFLNEVDKASLIQRKKKKSRLSKAQNLLVKKINSAKDAKQLISIWDNLDVTRKDLLPKGLTPVNMRKIDKIFLILKRQISQLQMSGDSSEEKDKKLEMLLKKAALKFAQRLQLLPKKSKINGKKFELKPARTLKQFKNLYNILYKKLLISKNFSKCAKLKRTYKSQKGDIQLLWKNNDKILAKQLIHSTSKVFLYKFLK